MFLGFGLIALQIYKQGKREQPTGGADESSVTQKTIDDLNAEHETTVKELNDRINRLEEEKTALETARDEADQGRFNAKEQQVNTE